MRRGWRVCLLGNCVNVVLWVMWLICLVCLVCGCVSVAIVCWTRGGCMVILRCTAVMNVCMLFTPMCRVMRFTGLHGRADFVWGCLCW